jgi:DNA-binding transcriptional ArsR family regulator
MSAPAIPQTAAAYDHVPSAEVEGAPLRVVVSPLPTALLLTRDALQHGRRGTPLAWRKAVLSQLRARDAEVLSPLVDPETSGWPTLLDDVGTCHESLDSALQRVSTACGTAMLHALETDRDVTPVASWDIVRRDPDRWLRGYVDAIARTWSGLQPLWSRSSALLEYEVDRIDASRERGVSSAQLINDVLPRTTLDDDALKLRTPYEPRQLRIHGDGIVMTPVIAGPTTSMIVSPGDELVRVAYPLREAWRAFDDEAPPPASLAALLGVPRAALLDRLDYPVSAGDLARRLNLSPSAVTFHLRALEAAGLVSRQRLGRSISVHRTSRGTRLIELYAVP